MHNPTDSERPEAPPVRPLAERTPGPFTAAVGVIAATMSCGSATAEEIAAAEEKAGLLFSPERADDVADAARAQAQAEARAETSAKLRRQAAEIEQLREYATAQEQTHTQLREHAAQLQDRLAAVLQLCSGRPTSHLMTAREILTAAKAPGDLALGAPLQMHWSGLVMGPSGDTDAPENTVVPCTTALGGPAGMVLSSRDAHRLAELLGRVRDHTPDDIEARCVRCGCTEDAPCAGGCSWVATAGMVDLCSACVDCGTPGCGLDADDVDESDPALWGWTLVQVAGTDGPARWMCSPPCAARAIHAAGEELAAADRAAEHAPDQTRAEAPAGGEDQ